MIEPYHLWTFAGVFYLVWLSFQDLKTKQVDDRKNYFMLGLTISLITQYSHQWYYLLCISIAAQIWFMFSNKIGSIGEGDNSALRWLFIGFGIIGLDRLLLFIILFSMLMGLFVVLKSLLFKLTKKENVPLPAFPIILITFCLANLLIILS